MRELEALVSSGLEAPAGGASMSDRWRRADEAPGRSLPLAVDFRGEKRLQGIPAPLNNRKLKIANHFSSWEVPYMRRDSSGAKDIKKAFHDARKQADRQLNTLREVLRERKKRRRRAAETSSAE
jgi:hypothetical protein